jgi:hypothetical protein
MQLKAAFWFGFAFWWTVQVRIWLTCCLVRAGPDSRAEGNQGKGPGPPAKAAETGPEGWAHPPEWDRCAGKQPRVLAVLLSLTFDGASATFPQGA